MRLIFGLIGSILSFAIVLAFFLDMYNGCASSNNEDSESCIEQTDGSASVQPGTAYGENVCYAFEA
ncbi:MAG: hypothetical protein LUE27_03950 [Clostridia bacterium]|nr:hypothetical protein [Clostridia bacterium]